MKSVARNYAIAFLNSFIDDISLDDFQAIRVVVRFLKDHKKMLSTLNIPGLSVEAKVRALHQVLESLSAPESLKRLMVVLVEHKRTALIPDVVAHIVSLYKRRKKIVFFTITSSHQLLDDELQSIQDFLAQKTGETILYDYAIDKGLVAGICCQSETLLWEHSVRKQLYDLRRQLIVQRET